MAARVVGNARVLGWMASAASDGTALVRSIAARHRVATTHAAAAPNLLLGRALSASPALAGERRSRSPITNLLWTMRGKRQGSLEVPHDVVDKRMSDSYTEAVFDFADCAELREEYLTYSGTIRVGRLLEDLDALAGTIAFRHCDDNNSASFPLSIVTASVDSISLLNKLTPDRLVSFEKLPRNLRMSGFVSYVGKSSMEVSICVDSPVGPSDEWEKMLTARLTMVARDPRTGRAAPINRLVCETDEERTLFEQGRRNTQLRKEGAQMSLSKQPPSESERLIIHDLYLASQPFEDNGALARDFFWVGETRLDGLHVCHPAEQNTNNKIFGGFLMRTAFELAWASACRHCQTHAFFLAVDEIHFLAPVEVGSLLQLTSNITFTAGGSMQCRVVATAINPRTGESKCATQLHFTFVASEQKTVRPVVPRTYSEAMLYIGGRRRLLAGRAIAREENSPMAAYYGED